MAYPGTLDSFTTKTDAVDTILAAHMNAVQAAIVTIETELGTDPAGTVTDLKTRLARSLSGAGNLNFATATLLTIAAGSITVTQNYHRVDTESSAATDNLDTITAGAEGQVLFLRQNNSARDVVIRHASGNIVCAGGANVTLSTTADLVMLMYDAVIASWICVVGGAAGSNRGGDVTGPDGGVTDGDAVVFNGTTGKVIKKGTASAFSDWMASGDTWTYSAADVSKSYLVIVTGDVTTKYSAGMKIKLTDSTVKYFIVTSVVESGGNTNVYLYGGTDYALTGGAISDVSYSTSRCPFGFPASPAKWQEITSNSGGDSQSTATQNTWYNLGSLHIHIPVGAWIITYQTTLTVGNATAGSKSANIQLSDRNNDSGLSWALMQRGVDCESVKRIAAPVFGSCCKVRAPGAAITMYLVAQVTAPGSTEDLSIAITEVSATCAFL
jgi:hypothetical protein